MTIITRDPAETLEYCYTYGKTQPENIDVVPPKAKAGYTPSRGSAWKLKRSKDGKVIVDVHPERHDVPETKRSRSSTTARIATGYLIGKVLAAAEKQSRPKANFLRFLHDPECPVEIRGEVNRWAKERMLMLIPARKWGKRKRVQETEFTDALLLHFSSMLRNGLERYSEADLCRYLGFVNMENANWERDWRKVSGDFLLQLQDFTVVAMRPVVDCINGIFDDPRNDKHIPVHPFEKPPEEAPKVEHYKTPNHGKTLSLKKVLAI